MPDSPRTAPPAPPSDAAVGYRPIAGLAIAALAVAILTAVVVTVIGITSWMKGAILEGWVIALAVIGLALSLAARWQIHRSEGTRAGVGLTSAGIWLCILFGFGYAAIYFGTHFAIRTQARDAADKWFKHLADEKPELAFRLLREPSVQRTLAEDVELIRRRFGSADLPLFVRSDLPRIFRTWPGRVRAEWTGIRSLETIPSGYKVELNYWVRAPEGHFDVGVTVLVIDDPETGVRDWQIVFNQTGIRERQNTRLGQMCQELQHECLVRFLPLWIEDLATASEAPIALFRIDGKVPPEDQREKLASELKRPKAIDPFPGGPLRPGGPPRVRINADGVFLVAYVELHLPTLSAALPEGDAVPGYITVQVTDEPLVQEILTLYGLDWEKQPTQSEWEAQLKGYTPPYGMKVVEIDAQPHGPREGALMRSVTPGGGG